MATNGRVEELRDHGIGDLVKELSSQVSTLVRQEVELAKAEVGEKGKKAGVGAGMFGGAGVAALLMLGSLTAFLILVLQIFLPDWTAALLVALLWGAVAGVLALRGRRKMQEMGKPIPDQTVESVKEDIQWVKHPTKSGSR
ncbi:MAG: hypothetical protein QOF43_2324 [Gaiellaceae bacterium]|nr:hypothetical protein [Gaiellaceae bacterium]